ncbi:MAG TPA: hypothetical protein VGC58_02535 [Candidatus Paceibacterota bacterium]
MFLPISSTPPKGMILILSPADGITSSALFVGLGEGDLPKDLFGYEDLLIPE